MKKLVMKDAWRRFKNGEKDTFANCLKAAWRYVKQVAKAEKEAESFTGEWKASVVSEIKDEMFIQLKFTKAINKMIPYSAFKKAENKAIIEKGYYDAATKSIEVKSVSFNLYFGSYSREEADGEIEFVERFIKF